MASNTEAHRRRQAEITEGDMNDLVHHVGDSIDRAIGGEVDRVELNMILECVLRDHYGVEVVDGESTLQPDKPIIVRMDGGLVQSIVRVPSGVSIVVYDYDTEGGSEEVIEQDETGNPCYATVFAGPIEYTPN